MSLGVMIDSMDHTNGTAEAAVVRGIEGSEVAIALHQDSGDEFWQESNFVAVSVI
jgi:hypothetical protein